MYGSWDPPGARLLDVVTVMDRLASPGGDPWKRQQTHQTPGPLPARGGLRGVRRDRGRRPRRAARGAGRRAAAGRAARPDGRGGRAGLVGRRRRRRRWSRRWSGATRTSSPDEQVADVDEITDNWERIKRAEKARGSALDGIALVPAGAGPGRQDRSRAGAAPGRCHRLPRARPPDEPAARSLLARRSPEAAATRRRCDAEARRCGRTRCSAVRRRRCARPRTVG